MMHTKNSKGLFVAALPLAALAMLTLTACGSKSKDNGGNTDGDVEVDQLDGDVERDNEVTDGDIETTDGDTTDGDATDGDFTEPAEDGDATEGGDDTESTEGGDGDDVPPISCTPGGRECNAAAGQYCDTGTGRCAVIACTDCASNQAVCAGMGALYRCTQYTMANSQEVSICLQACSVQSQDCPAGYTCQVGIQRCIPQAVCQNIAPPTAQIRDLPCDNEGDCGTGMFCSKFDGRFSVGLTNPPGGQCTISCQGNPNACNAVEACIDGLFECRTECDADATDPDQCGVGVTENVCTAWNDTLDVCLHWSFFLTGGTQQAGEECNPQARVFCEEGTICLGDGYCHQVCGDPRNFYGNCPSGTECTMFSDAPFGFCPILGSAGPGDACPFGGANAGADFCSAEGGTCLGIVADNESSQPERCQTDDDCLSFVNGSCTAGSDGNKYCGYSFCSPACGAGDTCEPGFDPQQVQGLGCACIPMQVGDSEAGDPCPFGGVHGDADFCMADLNCLGIAEAGSCATDADCNQNANGDCHANADGAMVCGYSFCAADCDANGDCDAGFQAVDVSGTCMCIPAQVGNAAQGDRCPFGRGNQGTEFCMADLTCLGLDTSNTCTTDADCRDTPNGDCAEATDGSLSCVYSFCSGECPAAGCPAGFEAANVPSGSSTVCFCIPVFVGNTAAGGACPFGGTNSTADYCMADLNCLGSSSTFGAPCAANADCTLNPNGFCFTNEDSSKSCSYSFCTAECGANNSCPTGTTAETLDGPQGSQVCYCVPATPTGAKTSGQSCQFLNVGAAAGRCAAGLTCTGEPAVNQRIADAVTDDQGNTVPLTAPCATATDCTTEGPFVGECVDFGNGDKRCGWSACYASCGTGNSCPGGTGPVTIGGDCACVPGAPTP